MSFKENLLKKIDIKKMAKKVIDSTGPSESGRRVDKATMARLLGMGPYVYRKERDLDLYLFEGKSEKPLILVLDNDLPFYRTTVEDVVLRKSPIVKEMISIRNAIKILNDSDVLVSKKEASVKMVAKECIDLLQLSYTESDLDDIAEDGLTALKLEDSDGMVECLSLFSELLEFEPPPVQLRVKYHEIVGELTLQENGKYAYGPVVIYSLENNKLRMIEGEIESDDKAGQEYFKRVVTGKTSASREGEDVLTYLKRRVSYK
ncbi:MAG: hypothetical protein PHP23_03630 [Desulfobacterales bacterium]|nr:hypothetical protein [Desulfobacterales bacterium]MDD4072932.1 hypothetical protein [Desulfobacterales bacterium]MDD4392513.1 hypothetical protein [Desulfobacterales bacterium]